ncbi:MAG: hypothetical protein ABI837_10625 [Acidobacteriota bacterium]
MNDDVLAVAELARAAASARLRILGIEGHEGPDGSWQRMTCHVHREDVSWAAVPLIYTIAALSFADARPRALSEADYQESDEWLIADTLGRIQLQRGRLVFDSDYIRGRMMKTRLTIDSDGRLVIEPRNRYEMSRRWLDILRGKRQIRLITVNGESVQD